MQKRILVIDFLRGMSILGVVFYHLISLYMTSLPGVIRYAANAGSSGVLIFFFCSGFSLHLSNHKKHLSYISFLLKKVRKIYLPYIFIVLVTACIPFIQIEGSRVMAILSHIFQFRIFNLQYFEVFGGHWWYLGTLFQFYIIFYVLERILDRISEKNFVIICSLLSVIYVIILAFFNLQDNNIFTRLFPKYLLEFSVGMAGAELCLKGKLEEIRVSPKVLVAIALGGIALLGLSSRNSMGRLLNDIPGFVGFLCLFIWIYLLKIKWIDRIVFWISNISFEWYLIHMLIFTIIFHFISGTILLDIMGGIIAIILSIAIAYVYHYFLKNISGKGYNNKL